ncbi:hypothetical protein PENSPDRAFT_681444 [Peniophora sp. CONT]|nr:hypothetical protein PENSPDRAFT_681444 [Peniophora sp. CONT]
MLPIPDILHRTLVYSLAGICVLGVGAGVAVTKDTVRRGQEVSAALEERKAAGLSIETEPAVKKAVNDEEKWAEMAQGVWERTNIGKHGSSPKPA